MSHPWLRVSSSQCTKASQAKVAGGRLMANALKRRSRIKGSTANSPIAKIAYKPIIACIHQYARKPNLAQRSTSSIM